MTKDEIIELVRDLIKDEVENKLEVISKIDYDGEVMIEVWYNNKQISSSGTGVFR